MSESELSMIELDEDLGDIEKPPELPAGKYRGEVVSVEAKKSGKGNDYYEIGIKVPPNEIPAQVAEHFEDGALMFWNRQLVVHAGSDRRTKYNLRKLVESMGLELGKTIDPNEWMGANIGIVVRHGQYQGETRAEIGSLYAAEEAPKKAAPAAAAKGRGRR